MLDFIALFDRLNGFCAGRLDLPTLTLYVGIAAIACLLLALSQKRPTRPRSTAAVALALCVIAAQLLPFGAAYPSILQGSPYRIPEKARQYLLTVDESVELIYYAKGGESGTDRDLYAFLLSMEKINPHIRVSVRDTADTEGAADQSIEVRSTKRSRSLRIHDLYYYFNSGTTSTLSMEEYSSILSAMEKSQRTESYSTWLGIYGPGTMKAYFSGAVNLTSAIRYALAKDAPTVYSFVKSQGSDIHPLLRQRIEQSGYTVVSLDSLDRLSQTVAPLLLTLTEDLTQEEASAVSDYLARGGKLLLTTAYDSPTHPNLSAVLAEYGLSSSDATNTLYQGGSQVFYPTASEHPVNDLFGGRFVAAYAHAISVRPADGVTQTVLLQTLEEASCIVSGKSEPLTGQFPLAVAARRGEALLVWLSMIPNGLANGISSGADFDYCVSILQWFEPADDKLGIADTSLPSTYYEPTSSGLISWVLVFAVGIPSALVLIGAVRIKRRKSRGTT